MNEGGLASIEGSKDHDLQPVLCHGKV
jgi:hypothetical protein